MSSGHRKRGQLTFTNNIEDNERSWVAMFNFVAEYTNYTITELEHRSYEEFFRILDHAESIVDARNKAMEPQGD